MNRSIQQNLSRLVNYLAESTWFAYVTIILLQIKVMLWIWEYRDLAPGDTSYYYMEVFTWLEEAKGNIVWSPLYTIFLAALHSLLDSPFWVLVVVQISIAVCASILVLALLRRLLPKHIAWIIAAWWALLPINFDAAYKVHIFSALFPLTIFVIAAHMKTIYGRGIVLGGFLLTAVLVRNEYSALFILWLFAFAGYEVYVYRREKPSSGLKAYLAAYGLPVLVASLIIGAFYVKSQAGGYSEIKKVFQIKHTENVCQIYAYNRRQQGDSWQGNPWNDCQDIIERDFGQQSVTFAQAFFLNPRAILEHIWWNIKLIPSGTQLALFNYYGGGPNPDYMRARQSPLVWVPFLFALGISAFAVIKCFIIPGLKNRRSIENKFVWLLLFSAALLIVGIMMMQRPRPSYMFPYTIFIMALTGLGLHGLFELMHISQAVKVLCPMAGILLILFVPSYYDADYINYYGYKGQPLRHSYKRIAPHIKSASINSPAVIVNPAGDYTDLCNYLGLNCRTLDLKGDISVDRMLEIIFSEPGDLSGENVYILYLEEMIWKFPSLPSQKKRLPEGYIELNCGSLINNIMNCSDGTIDLNRGIMNDGTREIPLRAALFVNDGYLADRKNYRNAQGYFLQVLLRNNKIYMILIADERLFNTNFNQQYLLGNYDWQYFEEVYNNFPLARVLKLKKQIPMK
jgi:hypothetical protein